MVDADRSAAAHPGAHGRAGSRTGADTVPALLAEAAREHGASPCLEMVGGMSLSYAQVHEQAGRVAGRLAGVGVRPGQRVLVMLRNSPQAVLIWLGINMAGAVEVSLNTGYLGLPLEHAINLSEAELIVTTGEFLPLIDAALPRLGFLKQVLLMGGGAGQPARAPQGLRVHHYGSLAEHPVPEHAISARDCASVIFTSGTSGPAKGVQMPHGQVTALARNTAQRTGIRSDDVFFCFYPLYHMAGKFMSLLATMSVGGKVVLDDGFAPDTWLDRIREHGATLTAAHGPMLEMVYALEPGPRDRDHKLRTVRTAPFPKRIAAQFEERFGVKGMEVWGMTEIGIPCWSPLDEPLRIGSCGRIDHEQYELEVVDPETDMPLPRGEVGDQYRPARRQHAALAPQRTRSAGRARADRGGAGRGETIRSRCGWRQGAALGLHRQGPNASRVAAFGALRLASALQAALHAMTSAAFSRWGNPSITQEKLVIG